MEKKSKAVAALLALFLGGLGAHKFYLGQPKQGILFIIFFWVAAFVSLVDFIKILTGKYTVNGQEIEFQ